jgi:acyl-coenzyme A thioesterase PaaI-like protein
MQVPPNCDLTLGIVCLDKSVPGQTTWAMLADERFANPAGIIQGGLLGAFADSAMGASAITFVSAESKGGVFCANVEMKTSFVKPVTAGTALTCVFCEAEIRDSSDRLVGTASSTYLIDPRAC